MAEIPADVFKYSLQQQVNNHRYSNKVTRDIIAILNDADAEILAKLEKWGDSGRFTPARFRALRKEILAMVNEAYAGAHEQISGDMAAFADHVAADTAGLIATQAPIAYNVVRATKEQLESIVSTIPVTVGPDKKLLLEEVFSSLAAGKEEDIRGAIRLGMVEGESIGDLTRRLRGIRAAQFKDGVLEVSRIHAETMCRTVVNHTSNQAVHRYQLQPVAALDPQVNVVERIVTAHTALYGPEWVGLNIECDGEGSLNITSEPCLVVVFAILADGRVQHVIPPVSLWLW